MLNISPWNLMSDFTRNKITVDVGCVHMMINNDECDVGCVHYGDIMNLV